MQTVQTPTNSQPSRRLSIQSSSTARSGLLPSNMPEPTLGCQIAPNYDREQWPYNSDSDSTDSESEPGSPVEHGALDDALAIEKAETQHSRGITPALSNINTQRSRRKSNLGPQSPASFWNWQMVRYPQLSRMPR